MYVYTKYFFLYRFEQISNEFELLGFNKVKDLAKTTLGNASKMALGGDPLAKLYQAIQVTIINK